MKTIKKITALFSAAVLICTAAPHAHAVQRKSLSYLFAGNTSTYTYNVDRTNGNINVVCPDYFEIDWNGTLKITRPVDPVFIANMHERGVKVTPFLSNHWNRERGRMALTLKQNLADSLRDMLVTYNLDGIDIDIENLTEADRDNFTDFIRVIRQTIPSDKTVTVCVPANPWNINVGWQGSCDYAALKDYADHIFIMAYDESYQSGPPGPVASLKFAEDSIKYGLKHVPKEKLMLGVPFYGRYWMQGASTGGYGVAVSSIENLISAYPSNTWYDSAKDCARAVVTIDDVNAAFQIWGGRQLKKGIYDIWYEDKESIEKKISLAAQYDLLGVGSWSLGQEPVSFWTDYRTVLTGLPFYDIVYHWAQQYIVSLHDSGVVTGSPQKHFNPDSPLTRAEAAALIVRLAGIEDAGTDGNFFDVSGHWAEKYIAVTRDFDLFQGNEEGRFDPDRYITREEFAVLADRYLNLPPTVDFFDRLYPDVSPETNPWSNDAIVKLTLNKVLHGGDSGLFRPGANITRGEAAKVFDVMSTLPSKIYVTENNVIRKIQPMTVNPR